VWLPSKIPSIRDLKYSPVPPQRIGDFPLERISSILESINCKYSPDDTVSLKDLNPIKW